MLILTLYLVRAGFTEKKLLNFPIEAKREGKLHDMGYILNDVEAANFGYGTDMVTIMPMEKRNRDFGKGSGKV